MRLFADDTIAYLTISSDQDARTLQSDLDKLEKWETSWLMAFHPEKCNVLTITKKRNPIKFNYTLHGHSLEHVTSAKYLGCTITSDLKWGPHINNICNKANSTYRQLPQEKSEYCQQISQRKGLSVTSETILRIL